MEREFARCDRESDSDRILAPVGHDLSVGDGSLVLDMPSRRYIPRCQAAIVSLAPDSFGLRLVFAFRTSRSSGRSILIVSASNFVPNLTLAGVEKNRLNIELSHATDCWGASDSADNKFRYV